MRVFYLSAARENSTRRQVHLNPLMKHFGSADILPKVSQPIPRIEHQTKRRTRSRPQHSYNHLPQQNIHRILDHPHRIYFFSHAFPWEEPKRVL